MFNGCLPSCSFPGLLDKGSFSSCRHLAPNPFRRSEADAMHNETPSVDLAPPPCLRAFWK
ncbi:hypothetical protein M407DRAFT_241693 [Tulasnella calospora MUT 4182]|uniref:Uncharacterized protein n=1 Tax=Tulasnella calospora MUT 4182 TaxID=1051891 RepID=A0A0C3QTZ4_9AGAM|nr:hypothetical protein M407DRAFT_241693 [Tulasnella calospora MUT 4182]